MSLLQNKVVVAALATAAFGYAAWTVASPFLGRRYPKNHAAPQAAAPTTPVTPALPPNGAAKAALLPIDLAAIREALPGWLEAPSRDPFETYALRNTGPRGPSAAELLALKAIWRQSGGRLAVINNVIVSEGDEISGFKVQRIEGDIVWVRGSNGVERIQFKSPPGHDDPTQEPPRGARQRKPTPS